MDDIAVHHGDNLAVLRDEITTASIDLIYLDPPFNSRKRFDTMPMEGRDVERFPAFDDRQQWGDAHERLALEIADARVGAAVGCFRELLGDSGLSAYLLMMAPRLIELRRVLAPTGSLYLHCDGAASHYLKILLDAVFGRACFLNNVVWLYGLGGSSARRWPRKHDDLLWYAREAGQHYFEPSLVPATSNRLRGRMKKAPDYWSIPAINNMARERTGWPTQKPEALLERIVQSSCPPGGRVLDPFCGSGTTLVVARRLARRGVGIDVAPEALAITTRRLESTSVGAQE